MRTLGVPADADEATMSGFMAGNWTDLEERATEALPGDVFWRWVTRGFESATPREQSR